MVEHLAAIVVVALSCVTVATVASVHSQMVMPARMDALAQQVALNMVRINQAGGGTRTVERMGSHEFTARIVDRNVEVSSDASSQKWRYTARVHDD
ncbi:hypothetical protein [Lacticaseibacillus zhaodongensis]|uniref:hypothetical protein n=1 Tax=Lacticaseibacillus zhaodongensis TaxID=2668065 RepID=UPI0012D35DBB|nr:hypothetical protein [Lacticaseibacillus zhaodongensis]